MPDLVERIGFVPHLPRDEYLNLLWLADCILDTHHYAAGSTCYDVFSLNLPIVTWPGEFSVGRYTLGCYRRMGFLDLVADSAESYVQLALRLASDADFSAHCRREIAARSDILFNDRECVRELEAYFNGDG